MKILCRYVLAWMGALGIMNVYFCRINLSVAMVAMVGVSKQSNLSESHCPDRFSSEEVSLVLDGEFDWSKKLQGLVMGSYYWGYAACQVNNTQTGLHNPSDQNKYINTKYLTEMLQLTKIRDGLMAQNNIVEDYLLT